MLSAPSSKSIKNPIAPQHAHHHLLGIRDHLLFLNYGYSSSLFSLFPYWLQYSQNKLLDKHSPPVSFMSLPSFKQSKGFFSPVTQNKIQSVDPPLISLISSPSFFLSLTPLHSQWFLCHCPSTSNIIQLPFRIIAFMMLSFKDNQYPQNAHRSLSSFRILFKIHLMRAADPNVK